MIFTKFSEQNGWIVVDYTATWTYGYDFMLDAAQTIIDTDFKDKLQRVATAQIAGAPDSEKLDGVNAAGRNLRGNPRGERRAYHIGTKFDYGMPHTA